MQRVDLAPVLGALVALAGALGVGLWLLPVQPAAALAWVQRMGLNTPAMLLLAGAVLCLVRPGAPALRPVARLPVWLLGAYALALMSQYATGVALGLDFPRPDPVPGPQPPYPGRPAPNTLLCFILVAVGLWLRGSAPTARRRLYGRMLAALVMFLAGAALAAALLDLSPVFPMFRYNAMLWTTAILLALLGAGLYLEFPAPAPSPGGKIHFRITVLVLLLTAATGVAGFVIMRGGLEQALLDNLRLATSTGATSVAATLEDRTWLPRTAVTRPSVLAGYRRLATDPRDTGATAALLAVADNLLASGIAYVRFTAPGGVVLVERGVRPTSPPRPSIALDGPSRHAQLAWQEGYYLQTDYPVMLDGKPAGTLFTEQAMSGLDQLVGGLRQGAAAAGVLLCGGAGGTAVCTPSYPSADGGRQTTLQPHGAFSLPIRHALAGRSGTMRTADRRGLPVLAAYVPVQGVNLAIVLYIDEGGAYAPLRDRVGLLGIVMLGLILLGALSLRLQVRPLLASLVHEQTRNRVILANSNDAFIALDAAGRISAWNRQAERLFGWSEHETLGRELADLIIPARYRDAHRQGLARFAVTGAGPVVNRQVELSALRRDGGEFPIELSVTGYAEQGAFVSNAFIRDISSRKAAERQLADSERLLRTVADNMPALIGYVGADDRYRFANGAFSMLGMTPATVIGRPVQAVMGPDFYRALCAHTAQRTVPGERVRFEYTHGAGDTLRHFLVDHVPETDGHGDAAGYFLLMLDITERKQAELKQAESEQRAGAASRAKSAFLANMSHEIRTPMNAVLGMTHLLARTELAPLQRRYVEMVRQAGSSLLNLLNDILDFSKVEAGKMELVEAPFRLDDLLNAIATMMAVGAEDKHLELAIGVAPGVAPVWLGDAARLEQILINLVGNAIKFTARGEVTLQVDPAPGGDAGPGLCFRVRDTGIGMSAEQQERIFAAFTQADTSTTREFGGTGLGLAISRRLAALMGGSITVDSVPGQGSTFLLALPLRPLPPGAEPALPAMPPGLRVLVAEPHATGRQLACRSIAGWHWAPEAAATFEDCLRRLRERAPACDVVLLDAGLAPQGLAGIQCRSAAASPALPLVLTGALHAGAQLQQAAAAVGHAVTLTKPYTPAALHQAVRQACAGQEAPAAQPAQPPAAAPEAAARLNGVSVLLVEDNLLNQAVAITMLRHEGARVEVCGNGAEAVALLAAPHSFHVVLMDVQMPVMDGVDATRLIRRGPSAAIPVIAMSAGVLPEERARCSEAGMDAFVAKPVDAEEMVQTVARFAAAAAAAQPRAPAPSGLGTLQRLLALSANKPAQRDAFVQLVEKTVASSPAELAQAWAAFERGEREQAARVLHALRGGIGSMGAKAFAGTTVALEKAMMEAPADAGPLFALATRQLQDTLAEVRAWLDGVVADPART